jgi:hypothetical protein
MCAITRLLAFFCSVCPFCRRGRNNPLSLFARSVLFRKLARFCPFCRAYAKLHPPQSHAAKEGV